jgi:hypothetical protein
MRAPLSLFGIRMEVQKFQGNSRATRLLVGDGTELPARAPAASYNDELTQGSFDGVCLIPGYWIHVP